ncbi:hypothetical protein OUZ56_024147 [Daphnia magna]|uniref:Uncharacterized protein n=1 Tax=Daphnia magna TaxID=35525 RepID=A0ABR0B0A1_9CRUS|nr:hypothetical protein OUZ56_024147 [Daphnia magna]
MESAVDAPAKSRPATIEVTWGPNTMTTGTAHTSQILFFACRSHHRTEEMTAKKPAISPLGRLAWWSENARYSHFEPRSVASSSKSLAMGLSAGRSYPQILARNALSGLLSLMNWPHTLKASAAVSLTSCRLKIRCEKNRQAAHAAPGWVTENRGKRSGYHGRWANWSDLDAPNVTGFYVKGVSNPFVLSESGFYAPSVSGFYVPSVSGFYAIDGLDLHVRLVKTSVVPGGADPRLTKTGCEKPAILKRLRNYHLHCLKSLD